MILTLLILGKELVTFQNFDVYLEPIIEKLQELWKGVTTYDVLQASGFQVFHFEKCSTLDYP